MNRCNRITVFLWTSVSSYSFPFFHFSFGLEHPVCSGGCDVLFLLTQMVAILSSLKLNFNEAGAEPLLWPGNHVSVFLQHFPAGPLG